MIELIAAAVSGAVVGYVGAGLVWQKLVRVHRQLIAEQRQLIAEQRHCLTDAKYTAWQARDTLTALRSNCFIPDERGVKVRYSQASLARRVKAETPKEVV